MHFSTADCTSLTSGEDEEELNLYGNAFAKLMMTTGMRRKRFAESDSGDLSVSNKPAATKRRAVTNTVYVDIPVWSANVSVGSALTLISFDSSYRLSRDSEG
jgi:hypothetical protein